MHDVTTGAGSLPRRLYRPTPYRTRQLSVRRLLRLLRADRCCADHFVFCAPTVVAPITSSSARRPLLRRLFRLLRADLLVPDPERFHLRLGLERLRMRELLEPAFVFGTTVFLDRFLTFLRRHRQAHVLD